MLARHAAGRAAPTAEPPAPAVAAVDEGYLGLLVDSIGADKVRRLIAELPGHADPLRARLAAARARDDLPEVRAAAHSLGGIASNLGLLALSELTGGIEEACIAGEAGRAAALSEHLDGRFAEALSRLRALGW